MTTPDYDAIERRCAAVKAAEARMKGVALGQSDEFYEEVGAPIVDFEEHARTDIPALLARVRALEAREAEARRLIREALVPVNTEAQWDEYAQWQADRTAYLSAKGARDGE